MNIEDIWANVTLEKIKNSQTSISVDYLMNEVSRKLALEYIKTKDQWDLYEELPDGYTKEDLIKTIEKLESSDPITSKILFDIGF